jgi:hypothetical protein
MSSRCSNASRWPRLRQRAALLRGSRSMSATTRRRGIRRECGPRVGAGRCARRESDLRYCDRSAGTDGGRVPGADDREATTGPLTRLDASLTIQKRVFCPTRVAPGSSRGRRRRNDSPVSSSITDLLHHRHFGGLARISPVSACPTNELLLEHSGNRAVARYVLTLEGKREPEEQQRDLPPGISTVEMPRPI